MTKGSLYMAVNGAVPIECEHGYDACPICDEVDGPWVAERGHRMPSGKYWWVVRHRSTGEEWATDKKSGAEAEADQRNREYRRNLQHLAREANERRRGWVNDVWSP